MRVPAASVGPNRCKPTVPGAEQEKADAAVHMTGLRLWAVEILDEIEVCVSVAIDFSEDDPEAGRELGDPWERLEFESRISVIQKETIAQVGIVCPAAGPTADHVEILIAVVVHIGKGRSHSPPAAVVQACRFSGILEPKSPRLR